ncbi:phosphoribosyltransferase family protein [Microbacterium sp. X-17]|uniref:ComF family protein n=1 Tax=Microbacterium sp. X-17 TaxID=3144404 RepID=UPI0031F5A037
MGLTGTIRRAAADALAFVLPVECAGCGEPDTELCEACRAVLVPTVVPRRLDSGLVVHAGLVFDGVVARVVRALKEDGRTGLARTLAPALAAAADAAGRADAIVPIPSSRAAMRRRGYAVVELLTQRAGLPVDRLLLPDRRASDQRRLGREARRVNVAGAFRGRPAAGIRVLLTDDVATTGATLDEAARTLREAGAEVLGAAVVAATPRRLGESSAPRNNP